MIKSALMILCLLAPSAFAGRAPAGLELQFVSTSNPKEAKRAQKKLAKWLKKRAKREFPAKIYTLTKRRQITLAQQAEPEMRDAVSSVRPAARVLCPSLELCPAPPALTHAGKVSDMPDAVFSLINPWLLLAQRRGGAVALNVSPEDANSVLSLSLGGLLSGPILVNASPDPMGGIAIWLSGETDLNEIYAYSREAVLAAEKLSKENPARPY